ncbi:MAG TPA: saccharopine dehydrogenase, partial [Ferruginibacter sp.]|nr:saccharopine dehydrogenase [Ferruginibacter sp.]
MKTIVLIGAGKSATVLIDYLIREAGTNNWKFIIADSNRDLILAKTNNSPFAEAIQLDVTNEAQRSELIQR